MRKYMLVMVLLLLVDASPALAHKVMLFAFRDGGQIYAEGYFSDGKKALNSEIEVFDESGNRLLAGQTDADGSFTFDAPSAGELRLVLNASMGHRAEFILEAAGGDAESVDEVEVEAADATVVLDEDRLRRIVDEALDARLEPLVKAVLASQQKGPSVTEIFGGIGYIFGLMGIAIYFRSKKQD